MSTKEFFFIFTAHIRRTGEGNVFNLSICSMWGGRGTPVRFPVPSPDSGPRSFPGDTLVSGPISLLRGGIPVLSEVQLGAGLLQSYHRSCEGAPQDRAPSQDWGHPPPPPTRTGLPLSQDWVPPARTGVPPGPGQVTLRFPAGRTFLSILNF